MIKSTLQSVADHLLFNETMCNAWNGRYGLCTPRTEPNWSHKVMAVLQAIQTMDYKTDCTERKRITDSDLYPGGISNELRGSHRLESVVTGAYCGEDV